MDFDTDARLELAGFSAIDYFKDGSLYLLDAPGVSHIYAKDH